MSTDHHPLKVLSGGIISLILTIGIARFAYTPLLEVMHRETWLDDASGGWLASYNYIGYFLGAIIASQVSNLIVKDRLYRIGLLLAVFSTAAMAFTENMLLWSVLRFIAGLSSAAGLLIGSGIILNWLMLNNHRSELGIHFSGLGLGIAFSALSVHLLQVYFDWRDLWLILSTLGGLLLIPAWFWVPRPNQATISNSAKNLIDSPPSKKFLVLIQFAYFCAGVSYVITATFIVTIIERQASLQGQGWLVFLVIGLAAAPACIFWDRVARKIGTINALLSCYCLQIIGNILPQINDSLPIIMFSAALFGGTFIGIVSLVLTMAGRFYPTKPAKLMGGLTLSYGLAQIAAPAFSGLIAQSTGSYDMALITAIIFMIFGALIIAYLHRQDHKV